MVLRAQLLSRNNGGHFVPQIRKLVLEYCDVWSSSQKMRKYLLENVHDLARQHPHIEIVVRQRLYKEPLARGFYINNRTKEIPLGNLEPNGIQKKIQLLLDASGAKIKPLKNNVVESTTESPRGVWSGFHVSDTFRI